MLRKIITIDQKKCNGCGLCAVACHEQAISMVNGKATLLRDDYCDGLGDCLPVCPTNAISFELREAAAYDEVAVLANQTRQQEPMPYGCTGTQAKLLHQKTATEVSSTVDTSSQLCQWPLQIKLVNLHAEYLRDCNLLIAADCTAFAYGDFHRRFIKNHITLIGCPKLDNKDYSQKLTEIIAHNDIKSVTVVRMEVPCCGGIEQSTKAALQQSGKLIPWQVVTISTDGQIIDETSTSSLSV